MYRGKEMFPDTFGFLARIAVVGAFLMLTVFVCMSAAKAWGWLGDHPVRTFIFTFAFVVIILLSMGLAIDRKEQCRILLEEVDELKQKLDEATAPKPGKLSFPSYSDGRPHD